MKQHKQANQKAYLKAYVKVNIIFNLNNLLIATEKSPKNTTTFLKNCNRIISNSKSSHDKKSSCCKRKFLLF